MANGDIKKEWQKQQLSSFFGGIMKAVNEKKQREQTMAYEQSIYERGKKDNVYKTNVQNLMKMAEHTDPKIQQFAFKELNRLGVISETPEMTPYNELAEQTWGLNPGARTEYMKSGYYNPGGEQVTITQDMPIAKEYPNMVGKIVSPQDLLDYSLGRYKADQSLNKTIYGSGGSNEDKKRTQRQRELNTLITSVNREMGELVVNGYIPEKNRKRYEELISQKTMYEQELNSLGGKKQGDDPLNKINQALDLLLKNMQSRQNAGK